MTIVDGQSLALPGRLTPTDLRLSSGGLICLIGPNGGGKTSLLHAFAGIGRPQGVVRIDGIDPRGLPPISRSRLLSFLPASRELIWPLAARDLAALGQYGDDADVRVAAALSFLGLDALADRRADRLSTGERSRVLIARALASDARLLLLDEPTANLDPYWQLHLLDHLKDLAVRRDKIVLVALHDLEAARRHADRLIVMDKGKIAADGDPRLLLEGPDMRQIFGISWSPQGWLRADRQSSP